MCSAFVIISHHLYSSHYINCHYQRCKQNTRIHIRIKKELSNFSVCCGDDDGGWLVDVLFCQLKARGLIDHYHHAILITNNRTIILGLKAFPLFDSVMLRYDNVLITVIIRFVECQNRHITA